MANVLPTPADALRQPHAQARLVLDVQKTDGMWLSLSDRVTHDRLIRTSGLQRRQEARLGAPDIPSITLTVWNGDHWWDQPPPAGITTWYRRPVRITVATHGGTLALGIWLIEALATSAATAQATIRLVGIAQRLADRSAAKVKHGQSWYTNRSIGWLVRELFKAEFTAAEVESWLAAGTIQSRYAIPLSAMTISADGSNRALSHCGRPPEWDGTAWREPSASFYGAPMCAVNDAASPWNGQVLVGIGGELWRWDPATDVWTWTGSTTQKIMHIWWQAVDHRAVFVSWSPDLPAATSDTPRHRSGAKSGGVTFYWCDPSNGFTPYSGRPNNVWTGHLGLRAGGAALFGTELVTLAGTLSGGGSGGIGSNMPLPAGAWGMFQRQVTTHPYDQWGMRWNAWNANDAGQLLEDMRGDLSLTDRHKTIPSAFLSFESYYIAGGADNRPLDYTWSFGQYAGCFALQPSGVYLAFFVVDWDATGKAYRWAWWRLNTSTGAYEHYDGSAWTGAGTTYSYLTVGSDNVQPYCLAFSQNGSELYIGCALWSEAKWTGSMPETAIIGYMRSHTWTAPTTGPQTRFATNNGAYGSTDLRSGLIPLQILCADDASTVFACTFLNWKDALGARAFAAGALFLQASDANKLLNLYTSPGRCAGLVRDATRHRVYFQDAGLNRLMSMPESDTLPQAEDVGLAPVDGDPALLAGLVYVTATDAVYGISGGGSGAQCDGQIMQVPITQKAYLWQFDNYLTDRIELAEWGDDDPKVWTALRKLRAVGDFILDFDVQGRGVFLPRPASLTVQGTFRAAGLVTDTGAFASFRVGEIEKGWGYDEIINHAEMTPAVVTLGQPEARASLLTRPSGWVSGAPGLPPAPTQMNALTQTVVLRCMRGGTLGDEDGGVQSLAANGSLVADLTRPFHRLRFAWLVTEAVVETQLLAATAAGSTAVQVPSSAAADIRAGAAGYGDVLRIADAVERTITASDYATVGVQSGITTLTLSAAVGAAYAVGTRVTVKTAAAQRWSDAAASGVTTLAATMTDAETTMSVTSVREIPLWAVIGCESEEMRVTGRNETANTLTVIRGVGGTTAAAHGTVGAVIRGYWAPILNATYKAGTLFPVGGTGLAFAVTAPAAGGSGDEGAWMLGDEITIVCPGLTLARQEHASVIAMDQTSIDRYGLREMPSTSDTDLLTYRQASEVVKRILTDFARPHFAVKLKGPGVTCPEVGTTWLVEDATVLPWATGRNPNGDGTPVTPDTARALGVSVRGFSFDLSGDALSVDARAVNRHVW